MADPAADAGVAIVGMGAVFPGAADATSYWRNIVAGVDAISDVPPDRWDPDIYYDPAAVDAPAASDRFYCRRGGFIGDANSAAMFDPVRFGIMPAAVDGTEPDQLLALGSAAAAISDAGGDATLPDRARIGVIVGRGGYLTPGTARLDQRVQTAHQLLAVLRDLVPGLDEAQLTRVREAFQAQLGPERPEASIGLVPNFAASRIANRFDFRGPAYTVDAACASSLVAVDAAVLELAAGRCDAVIAGAVHHCHHVTLWSVFTQLRALSPSQQIRPFDRGADGTLISEGTGMVLLKRTADAIRDGDRIYAVIRGTGVASDGHASSLMNPLPDGQALAVERAWQDARLDPQAPGSLGLLEGHGTATAAGDRAELTTLARVFGPPAAGPPIGLGTVKSMIGHAMPAAGIAGLIKAAFAVHHGVLPPTLHIADPHPALAGTRFRPVSEAQPWQRDRAADGRPAVRRAAVNAFGFGGINAHVLLEEAPPVGATDPVTVRHSPPPRHVPLHEGHEAAAPNGDEAAVAVPAGRPGRGLGRSARHPADGSPDGTEAVLVLHAQDAAGIASQLRDTDDLLTRRAATGPPPDEELAAAGRCRLAIVAPTPRRLALARKIADRGTPWRGRNDIWFTGQPLLADPAAKVAFVFPGLEPADEPHLGGLLDEIAAQLHLGAASLRGGDDIIERSLDLIACGKLLTSALGALGITPDLAAGHSLGEWTAMIVSEVYQPDAIAAFTGSLGPGALRFPDVVYAALGCGADQATAALHRTGANGTGPGSPARDVEGDVPRDVVVSHDNCPHQSVICGPEDAVRAVLADLAASGVPGQLVPLRSGFHTPMMEPYLAPVRESLAALPIQPPVIPVWSATTVAPFPDDPDEVRDLVVQHLLEPVRFRALTTRLHDAGARAFIQAGPGRLTGFVGDTLKGAGHLTLPALPAASAGTAGLAQLRRIVAAFWAEGRCPRFSKLPWAGLDPAPAPSGKLPQAGTGPDRAGTMPNGGAGGSQAGTGPAGAGTMPNGRAGGSRTAVRLKLGSPMIRLAGAVPPLAAPDLGAACTAGTARPAGRSQDPVLSELDAVLEEATAAARAVADAWANRATPTGTPEEAGTPEVAETRVYSLENLPYVRDHCILPQPDGWPDPSDRFPVVPLTTLLEEMSSAARQILPGHVVTGYSQIRATRWLTVAPPTTANVRATAEAADGGARSGSADGGSADGGSADGGSADGGSADAGSAHRRVRVSIDGYASGLVLLAEQYPQPPGNDSAAWTPLRAERRPPVTARELYQDRWMFHGPQFAGVAEVSALADDGIRGVLESLPAPGALLDSAGQLVGHWMQVSVSRDRNVFPVAVDAIRLYGPQPSPGERIGCTAWIRSVTTAEMRADALLTGSDGRPWAAIDGWTTRRFATDEAVWRQKFRPETESLAEAGPDGCLIRERWPDAGSRELIMRRYLNAAERDRYGRLDPRTRRRWLLAAVAAKDAARHWHWQRGGGPLFPTELTVLTPVGHGQPPGAYPVRLTVRGPFPETVQVTVTQAGDAAVTAQAATMQHTQDRYREGKGTR